MTKFRLIGAAVVSLSVLTSPVMAQNGGYPGNSIYCGTRQPGNPHSKYCDYQTWSSWRRLGAWGPTLDYYCYVDPAFVPGACGLDPRSRAY
jgi:hypothetical protein